MSITAIAVLAAIFVPFGLIGVAVIWCAREDAVRGRLTHHQNPRTRFRAETRLVEMGKYSLPPTG
jgi:hypothetical protein